MTITRLPPACYARSLRAVYVDMRIVVKSVLKDFLKKGDSKLTETNLYVRKTNRMHTLLYSLFHLIYPGHFSNK